MMISTLSEAHQLDVFTVRARSVHLQHTPALYCELDALPRLTTQLNENLDLEHLKSQHVLVSNELMQAYTCMEAARARHIIYLPAIVVDKTWIAYGLDSEKDLLIALETYRETSDE